MKLFNRIFGAEGETMAAKYLKNNKYKIIERNYKNKIGEIDIIAKQNDTIIFVEVKRRNTLLYGMPSEAVDKRKQEKIKKVALLYLQKTKQLNNNCRFDVVSILGDDITHIENAF